MADLDLDDLVEVGATEWERAALEWEIREVGGPLPWIVLRDEGDHFQHHQFSEKRLAQIFKRLQVLRAILSAVLPLALAGARDSLKVAKLYLVEPCDDCTFSDCADARQVRSTLSHIDTLIGKADNKGET